MRLSPAALRGHARLLPGVAAFGLFLVFAADHGGYAATTWYPGALFLLGLLLVVALTARGPRRRLHGAAAWSVGLLLAFTAWSFLSIAWAGVKGDAWDGANRTLLYLVAYALAASLPWRPGAAALTLATFAVGLAALGAWEVAAAVHRHAPSSILIQGNRLAEPTGYPNANAALLLAAAPVTLVLAARRELPVPVRALLLAATGVLVELALLSQSRGSLVGAAAAIAVLFALAPGRTRTLVVLLPVLAAVAATLRPILDVGEAAGAAATEDALAKAREVLALTAVSLAAAGAVLAALDVRVRRLELPRRRALAVVCAVAVGAGLVVLGGSVAGGAVRGDVLGSRFAFQESSGRGDIWRVALDEFARSPLHGVGADNFAVDYLRERRTDQEPLYPHSLALRLLSQTGIVGVLLFAGFLGCALAAAARRLRFRSAFDRAVAGAALAAFAYWLVHGSLDWLWEFPALAAPALACLGIAVALGRRHDGLRPRRRRTEGAALGLAGALAAGSLVLPGAAAFELQAAAHSWRTHPAAAFERLDAARTLNPLSDKPDLMAGVLASRLGDVPRMRAAFVRALARNPHAWYARLELGAAEAVAGRRAAALRELERARELNPRDSLLAAVERQVRLDRRPSLRALDRAFLRRAEALER